MDISYINNKYERLHIIRTGKPWTDTYIGLVFLKNVISLFHCAGPGSITPSRCEMSSLNQYFRVSAPPGRRGVQFGEQILFVRNEKTTATIIEKTVFSD